jgi:hypothetical protein
MGRRRGRDPCSRRKDRKGGGMRGARRKDSVPLGGRGARSWAGIGVSRLFSVEVKGCGLYLRSTYTRGPVENDPAGRQHSHELNLRLGAGIVSCDLLVPPSLFLRAVLPVVFCPPGGCR